MAHTPGPWIAIEQKGLYAGNYCIGRAEDHGHGPLLTFISVLGPNDICPTEYANSAADNAALIAASPDLLAACEAALSQWYDDDSRGYGTPEDDIVAEQLAKAIAKARGEQ